ncbi:MAG: O-antigen ligase family protein [Verrucomicrobiota bacterium JB023]|nr:O-antigen ligase family protein [Verrucomicrobiota bacterium JB023]
MAFSSIEDESKRPWLMYWTMVSVMIGAAILGTASKAGMLLAPLVVSLSVFWNRQRLVWKLKTANKSTKGRLERVFFVSITVLLGLLLLVFGIERAIDRWEDFLARFEEADRKSVDARQGMMLLMLRMAGANEGSWHGFGPGSFVHLVPHFTATGDEEVIPGVWLHGHSDPLQTLVEWGWLGFLAWAVLGLGAIVCGFLLLRQRDQLLTREEPPLVRAMLIALLVTGIHSSFDFPLSIYSIHLLAMILVALLWGLYGARKRRTKCE